MWEAVSTVYHGWVVGVRGDNSGSKSALEAGLAEAREGLALFRTTGTRVTLPQHMTMFGELLWRAGQLDEAIATLEEGVQMAERGNEHHVEPVLHCFKAQILAQQADICTEPEAREALYAQAEACFERSFEIARQQDALMLELRTSVAYYNYLVGSARGEEAYVGLKGVYDRFTEGHDTPDLVAARSLLEAGYPTVTAGEKG